MEQLLTAEQVLKLRHSGEEVYIAAGEALKLLELANIKKKNGEGRVVGLKLSPRRLKTNKKTYWIVVGRYAAKKPFRHETQPEAITEAKRLAEKYPDQVFTVCAAVRKFKWFKAQGALDVEEVKEEGS